MTPFLVKTGDLYYDTASGTLIRGERRFERHCDFLQNQNLDEMVEKARSKKAPRGDLKGISTVTIFTTTDCNAKCSYCYEHGIYRRPMSREVANDVADWIAKRTKKVSLRMFGGEPLFNREIIDILCSRLKECGVKYTMSIITNGYFLKAIPVSWHLKNVQVSIDGTSEVYLKEKGFRLEPVLSNIRNAIDDGIRVVVRLNVPEDETDMLALCDILKTIPGLNAYAHVLFSETPNYKGTNKVNWRLIKLGLYSDLKLPKYSDGYCMADQGRAVCINPEGKITLCEHYCDDEIIGSIYGDNYDWNVIQAWREFIPQTEECKECFYRPICHKLRKCHDVSDSCTKEYRDFKYREIQQKMIAIDAMNTKARNVRKEGGRAWLRQ